MSKAEGGVGVAVATGEVAAGCGGGRGRRSGAHGLRLAVGDGRWTRVSTDAGEITNCRSRCRPWDSVAASNVRRSSVGRRADSVGGIWRPCSPRRPWKPCARGGRSY